MSQYIRSYSRQYSTNQFKSGVLQAMSVTAVKVERHIEELVFSPDDILYRSIKAFLARVCILNYEIIVFRNSNNGFSNHFRLSECLQTHAPFMSIKSIFNPDWLRYNLRNEFGYVARPVPNSIRSFFPSLTSICPIVDSALTN